MSSLTPNAGQIYTCKHLMRVKSAIECVFCHRDELAQEVSTLRNDLTAARLERDEARNDLQEVTCGDVMYTSLGREVERLRHEVSRLNMRCEAMGWMLYPHSDPAREAVAGDIGWPGSTALTAYDRLQGALFRHACYCGCGSPEPGLHREDCTYRVACTPDPTGDDRTPK